MNIAFLTGIDTKRVSGGGSVHAAQVASALFRQGHALFTDLASESDRYIKLSRAEFRFRAKEIECYYVRIDGWPERDLLTLHRRHNLRAPCLWEVNAPLEELLTKSASRREVAWCNARRRSLARYADAAVCVSDEMEEYARSFLGIRRTRVFPNGSDVRMFSPGKRVPRAEGSGKFRVIWTGSPEYRWQGLDLVKNVARRILAIDREVELVVTADGESTENLVCAGRIPYEEMPRHIASSDAALCLYEPIDYFPAFYFSPLKLFDYMASSVPVIGSDMGQIRQIIRKYGNGLLADGTPESVIEKILFLKRNPESAREMGRRGRAAVAETHNWDRIASAIGEIAGDLRRSPERSGLSAAIGRRLLHAYIRRRFA